MTTGHIFSTKHVSPLLVLKGTYHYWTYFLNQMEVPTVDRILINPSILIGGASNVGKTTFGGESINKLGLINMGSILVASP